MNNYVLYDLHDNSGSSIRSRMGEITPSVSLTDYAEYIISFWMNSFSFRNYGPEMPAITMQERQLIEADLGYSLNRIEWRIIYHIDSIYRIGVAKQHHANIEAANKGRK